MSALAELERTRPVGRGRVLWETQLDSSPGPTSKNLTGLTTPEQAYELIHAGQRVFDRLAVLPPPHGRSHQRLRSRWGLELALACRYRVASQRRTRERLVCPRCNLAFILASVAPSAAVQIVGVREAMRLMLTGRPVKADEGYRLGLVDQLVPVDELRARAKALALAAPSPRSAGWLDVLSEPQAGAPDARQAIVQASERAGSPGITIRRPTPSIELWERYGARGAKA